MPFPLTDGLWKCRSLNTYFLSKNHKKKKVKKETVECEIDCIAYFLYVLGKPTLAHSSTIYFYCNLRKQTIEMIGPIADRVGLAWRETVVLVHWGPFSTQKFGLLTKYTWSIAHCQSKQLEAHWGLLHTVLI